jgi:hypothetical protein
MDCGGIDGMGRETSKYARRRQWENARALTDSRKKPEARMRLIRSRIARLRNCIRVI